MRNDDVQDNLRHAFHDSTRSAAKIGAHFRDDFKRLPKTKSQEIASLQEPYLCPRTTNCRDTSKFSVSIDAPQNNLCYYNYISIF